MEEHLTKLAKLLHRVKYSLIIYYKYNSLCVNYGEWKREAIMIFLVDCIVQFFYSYVFPAVFHSSEDLLAILGLST